MPEIRRVNSMSNKYYCYVLLLTDPMNIIIIIILFQKKELFLPF